MARFELAMWGPDPFAAKLCDRIAELGPEEFLHKNAVTDQWSTLETKSTDKEPGNDSVNTFREDEWILMWDPDLNVVGLAKDTSY